MTKEKTTKGTAPLGGSAFARMLAEIMEERGIPADQEHTASLAERSGLDSEVFRARLAGEPGADPGDLSRLAEELALSRPERKGLALAYVFEEEAWEPMTKKECELWDARADHEESRHAQSILEPMATIAREVGNVSLGKVMDKAVAEVEEEVNRTTGVLEALARETES